MNELRKAAIAAHEMFSEEDIQVANFDDEESFVEKVEGGYWVEARVWVPESRAASVTS